MFSLHSLPPDLKPCSLPSFVTSSTSSCRKGPHICLQVSAHHFYFLRHPFVAVFLQLRPFQRARMRLGRNRHMSLQVAAKLLLAQIKYVDIRDFYASFSKSSVQIQLPGPRHVWQDPEDCSNLSQLLIGPKGFSKKITRMPWLHNCSKVWKMLLLLTWSKNSQQTK